ncbi:hypothetical protein TSOC_002144 [Tetrabaena socialis]|uniref:Uncharacterized protein n=1 Tax=Tetrabaena socialis TaxID=47790 RepID=A0A2J8AEY0_9CHLO|nr:hypothetical protein TSOC_002144 [Tetrabaena socialis]|eukprot:PNH11081.1 hypothetical protein TSOC_002144 [Tetrabaena socialis]
MTVILLETQLLAALIGIPRGGLLSSISSCRRSRPSYMMFCAARPLSSRCSSTTAPCCGCAAAGVSGSSGVTGRSTARTTRRALAPPPSVAVLAMLPPSIPTDAAAASLPPPRLMDLPSAGPPPPPPPPMVPTSSRSGAGQQSPKPRPAVALAVSNRISCSRSAHSRDSHSSIMRCRSGSRTRSSMGGSVASKARLARILSIRVTSCSPAGSPSAKARSRSCSTSGPSVW